MTLREMFSNIKSFMKARISALEAYLHEMVKSNSTAAAVGIKILLILLAGILMFIPLYIGIGIYFLILMIAGWLGIAVLITKILVFCLLLVMLGQFQLILIVAGITAMFLVIIA